MANDVVQYEIDLKYGNGGVSRALRPVASNLNECRLRDDGGWATVALENPAARGESMSVYFRGMRENLIEHIERAEIVVGCVAWLTDEPILNALAGRRAVSIVVQKEDFLRPESEQSGWKEELHRRYSHLPEFDSRYGVGGRVAELSVCGDPTLQAVRCAGKRGGKFSPRMHHKFGVFCRLVRTPIENSPGDATLDVTPYGVWTGSFNWTKNSTASLENALYTEDAAVVRAYYQEWEQIVALSEPLNWESEWVDPEWRFGT